MSKTYGNASAAEIAKYHIHPDVIARWPMIEEWAASHDQIDDLKGASDFRDMCVDAMHGDNEEDRILDAIRLGERLRRLRKLEPSSAEAIELAAELGVSI